MPAIPLPPRFAAPYAPLAGFVAPAVGRTEPWRTLAGLAITAAFYLFALRLIATAILTSFGSLTGVLILQDMALGASPQGVVALLASDITLAAGLALGTALVLNRGPGSLIGPLIPAWRSFLWAAGPLVVLWIVLLPLQLTAPNVRPHLTLWDQLRWLPLALPALLIQTGTEELIFRGYLQQQLAARWTSRWVWMGAPAALFGALHWSPAEYGPVAPLVVLWAAAFGLAAADLTARTGNLGAAIGLHFAANAQSLFLIGLYGNLNGLALYTIALPAAEPWAQLPYLAIDCASLLVSWLAIRLVQRV
ncbi:MAG: CPBP family intramembrane glutamic endopeptidase [Cypionkella sp.]